MNIAASGAPGMSFLSPFACLGARPGLGETKNSGAKTEFLDDFLWCTPEALPGCPRAGFNRADTPSRFLESPNVKRGDSRQCSWPTDCLACAGGAISLQPVLTFKWFCLFGNTLMPSSCSSSERKPRRTRSLSLVGTWPRKRKQCEMASFPLSPSHRTLEPCFSGKDLTSGLWVSRHFTVQMSLHIRVLQRPCSLPPLCLLLRQEPFRSLFFFPVWGRDCSWLCLPSITDLLPLTSDPPLKEKG